MKSRLIMALSVITFLSILSGCAEKQPPYYGGFLKDGRNLIEVPELEIFDIPGLNELNSVPAVDESQPTFVLWQPYIRLDYLIFISVDTQEELEFHATPVGDGILELQPAESLALGHYCYIQGDPLKAILPGWCFRVSSTGQSNPLSMSRSEISVAQAYELYPDGAFFLDVREVEEWDAGHVPDTTNIPLSELENRLDELPTDQDIVVICRSGNRSTIGRDILLDAGFKNVTSMQDGLREWKASGYPFEGEVLED